MAYFGFLAYRDRDSTRHAGTEGAIIAILQELIQRGRTVFVVHHDLQTVRHYFDELIMLNMRIVASGPTEDVFTQDNLKKTYGGKLTLLDEAAQALAEAARR